MAWERSEDKMAHSKGNVPWHHDSIEANSDFETMFETGGLGFPVKAQPLYIPGSLQDTLEYVPGKVAQVRMDTNRFLGVTSDRYQTVQPRDAFEPFNNRVADFNLKYATAGYLKGGSLIWMLAQMEDDYMIAGIDRIRKFIMLVNSYDGSTGTGAIPTDIRVQCRNTFSLAARQRSQMVVSHLGNMNERIKQAANLLTITSKAQQDMYARLEVLAQINTTDEMLDSVMTILNPKPEATEEKPDIQLSLNRWEKRNVAMLDMYLNSKIANDNLRDSAYGLFNFSTEWIDRGMNTRGSEMRMFTLLTGTQATLRTKVFNSIAKDTAAAIAV